jgi:hypothetical protein
MPAFRELRSRLPWPVGSTTSAEACGEALAGAVVRRARRVYVPRSAAIVHALRAVIASRPAEAVMHRTVRDVLPDLEAQVLAHREGRAPEPLEALP